MAYFPKRENSLPGRYGKYRCKWNDPDCPGHDVVIRREVAATGTQCRKIYGVHGRVVTPEELRASIDKRRGSELKVATGQILNVRYALACRD